MINRPKSKSYREFVKEIEKSDENRLQDLIEQYVEEYRHFLLGLYPNDVYEDKYEDIDYTILVTESPIERLFYIAFKNVIREETSDPLGDVSFDIKPQVEVSSHRVDFVMSSFTPTESVGSVLFIELDGHEYHSTKEQKKADNQRTRVLSSEADAIIRFTGTEVYENPENCVHEAMRVLRKKHNKKRIALRSRDNYGN